MIKGIISLLTSGFIFKPTVLFGILFGFVSITNSSFEKIKQIITTPQNYLFLFGVVFIYVFTFKRIFKDEGLKIDFMAMILNALAESIIFILSYILSMSFVFMLGF